MLDNERGTQRRNSPGEYRQTNRGIQHRLLITSLAIQLKTIYPLSNCQYNNKKITAENYVNFKFKTQRYGQNHIDYKIFILELDLLLRFI